MPFKTFNNWLFDGNLKSEIPNKEVLLKYNSPITTTYVMQMFIMNAKLNHYLNQYFNNIGLRYLDKEDFFKFIKKCIHDFKVQRKSIPFIKSYRFNSQLFDKLRKKVQVFKNNDIILLCEMVDKSPEKELIYTSLGLDKSEKKTKKIKKKDGKESTIKTVDDLMKHIKIMKVSK